MMSCLSSRNMSRTVDQMPRRSWTRFTRLYFQVGDMQKGFTCLTHWLELEPNSVIALDRRALAHEQANNPDAAKKDYERICSCNPISTMRAAPGKHVSPGPAH